LPQNSLEALLAANRFAGEFYKASKMYQRILVAVDGSDTSNLALQEAIRLAKINTRRFDFFTSST
jgi:hypothetical protein